MSNSREYSDAPAEVARAIADARIIKDFLPPPAELAPRGDTTKVTISLTSRSVRFFKGQAHERGVPYQTLIRSVLDLYTRRYERERNPD